MSDPTDAIMAGLAGWTMWDWVALGLALWLALSLLTHWATSGVWRVKRDSKRWRFRLRGRR